MVSRGVNGVNVKDKIKTARSILTNAVNMNMSSEILLKISQKIDKYIVEYYRKSEGR
jgi:hypothetical protein